MITGVGKWVVASTPCILNCSVVIASTAAMTTGRYPGLQPAITALIATFSTVTGARFGGTTPMTSCGSRFVPPSIRSTRSGVGGMTGRPSVRPWSNMNSKTSSDSPTSMRRARSGLPSISAARRSAMPGSTDFEPHPGRDSGYRFQSTTGGGASVTVIRRWNSFCQSSRPNPTNRSSSTPSGPARITVGTVSRS